MQPVTIESKDYSNTLWLPQIVLLVLSLVLLWLAFTLEVWFLALLPVFMMMLYNNKQTLTEQSTFKFNMHTNGNLTLNSEATDSQNNDSKVVVQSIWYLPQVLLLKLNVKTSEKPVYLTVFRSVVGPADFSLLLVGLTQLNLALNNRRHSHV